MSDRYGTISNSQASRLRQFKIDSGNDTKGISSNERLNKLFGIPSINFGYSSVNTPDPNSVRTKFDVDSIEAGKDQNPDFVGGVNLNYGHDEAPDFDLAQPLGTSDKALHGVPNTIVPHGAVNNPTEERQSEAEKENYPTYDPDNRDGGGFGIFDSDKNVPQQHRESVGNYLQNYTRGESDNFGSST